MFLNVELRRVRDGRSFHDYPVEPLPFTESGMEVIRLTADCRRAAVQLSRSQEPVGVRSGFKS